METFVVEAQGQNRYRIPLAVAKILVVKKGNLLRFTVEKVKKG
jgi:hypothetical protein